MGNDEENSEETLMVKEVACKQHVKYFQRFLKFSPAYTSFQDCSRLYLAFLAISGLDILNALDTISEDGKAHIIEWVYSLQIVPNEAYSVDRCGFQGSHSHIIKGYPHEYEKGHIVMTYTALAILIILGDDLSKVNKEAVLAGIKALQLENGSFCAAKHEESDMRFVYCAACISYFLNDFKALDIDKLKKFIKSSINYDGGVGQGPDLESHGGSTFCAIAALHLCGILNEIFDDQQAAKLIRWCINRQVTGFQGRPNKLVDTCYSFWLGGTLHLLNVFDKIDFKSNRDYILSTQDNLLGGFAKGPDIHTDPLHTYLGLCGLSLMKEDSLLQLNPALNITQRAHKFLKGLHENWKS
ncbi:hypothetical protein RUM43_000742 [Polyplax serrata]|uniref:Geranylgeranyl transferase type-1 subunit beta n=1 Tax=Polyplax serrata TaxID=468196 RepID=A0AAN8SCY0_POLSC